MQELEKKIIAYIKKNKVSTTEVADCLGKTGGMPDVLPLNRQKFSVGKISYAAAIGSSNWDIHVAAEQVEPGELFFMDAVDVEQRALVGELVCKYVLLYRQAAGIITNGKMRDAHNLIKENYSVWCAGASPVGCFNQKPDAACYEKFAREIQKRKEQYHGAIAVCDDSGVVVVPKQQVNEYFYEKLLQIEEQEDIWFDCVDRLKWSTFDTVCLKKYKNQNTR